MSLGQRHWEQDIALLKWQISLLSVVLVIFLAAYFGVQYFNAELQRETFGLRSSYESIFTELQQIEQAEETVRQYIDDFNELGMLAAFDEEDRVAVLEDIRNLRNRHRMFPIEVQINEQERIPLAALNPDEILAEEISLRVSTIRLQISLLHEEDLIRFLNDFLQTGRILQVESCNLADTAEDGLALTEIIERQVANCAIRWFTFRREPIAELEG